MWRLCGSSCAVSNRGSASPIVRPTSANGWPARSGRRDSNRCRSSHWCSLYKEVFMSEARAIEGVKNVVLVHGGFVDGSGWRGVYDQLKKDGYNVTIVQNPTTSLADDVAVTRRALATQNGPAILVGHSYGGVVITEA